MVNAYIVAWWLYAWSPEGGTRAYGPYADHATCRQVQMLQSENPEKPGSLFPYVNACVELKTVVPKE